MNFINKLWYHNHPLHYLLIPVSLLFRLVVGLRRFCYCIGMFKSTKFDVPVIVVGNITAGGTGKTPFVIWLAEFFKQQGYKPGIVSRGYKAQAKYFPQPVDVYSVPAVVGDEAVLIAKRTGCPMVVAPKRVKAVEYLLQHHHCDIIISDDGLQHYALARDIEIAIVDEERGLGNGYCFPAGPLREPASRLKKVELVVKHGSTMEPSFTLQGSTFLSIKDNNKTQTSDSLKEKKIHAIAGIGNPKRFFDTLNALGLQCETTAFPDHYQFSKSDFDLLEDQVILMTEKDAVKCQAFADERFWMLPVEVKANGALETKLRTILALLIHVQSNVLDARKAKAINAM